MKDFPKKYSFQHSVPSPLIVPDRKAETKHIISSFLPLEQECTLEHFFDMTVQDILSKYYLLMGNNVSQHIGFHFSRLIYDLFSDKKNANKSGNKIETKQEIERTI